MKRLSATLRFILVALLVVPYSFQMLGIFSSYLTFYHRPFLQQQVASQYEELHTLILSTAEFEKIEWTETDREFEYLGKMYDVSKVSREGASYVITCENDSLEDLFLTWIRTAGKSKSNIVLQIQLVEPIVPFEITPPFVAKKTTVEVRFQNTYSSLEAEIVPPPPRFS